MKAKFIVELTFDEDEQIDMTALGEQIDSAVSDRIDGWYSVNVEQGMVDGPCTTCSSGPGRTTVCS